jgi:hypothetical protein
LGGRKRPRLQEFWGERMESDSPKEFSPFLLSGVPSTRIQAGGYLDIDLS